MFRVEAGKIEPRPGQHLDHLVRWGLDECAGEDLAGLIDDPWRSFECPDDPAGCRVSFSDPDFVASGRENLYYARAYEAPKPTVNGDTLRCEHTPDDPCVATDPCPRGEPCLAPDAPRAWSSPIWVRPVRD